MILDIIWLIVKIVAVLIVLVIGRALQIHWRIKATIKRLSAQGIENYPGNETFLMGAAANVVGERTKRAKDGV